MTDWDSQRTIEHRQTTLSFAVGLTDAFTGGHPDHDDVIVDLVGERADPVRNPSGYYVFVDLEADVVTLVVDGGDEYADVRRTVVLDESAGAESTGGTDADTHVVTDPKEPLEIVLTPTPAYAFPGSTTVVRGHVEDAGGAPIAGASVSLREFDPVVETTDTGEFALWVPATGEDVQRRDGRNVVVVDGDAGNGRAIADGDGADPTLVVSHPDHGERAEPIEVAAGTKTVQYVTIE